MNSQYCRDIYNNVLQSGPKTVQQRIQKTVDNAQRELTKYTRKGTRRDFLSDPVSNFSDICALLLLAQMTGYSLNVAIGLQVVISALITGLSAVTTGRHVSPTLWDG